MPANDSKHLHVHLVRPAWGQGKHFHMFEGTPPLGLAYIAAALLQAGHAVTVCDAVLDGWDNVMPYGPLVARGLANAEVVQRIPDDTQVLGISVTSTTDWPLVTDLVHRIRHARPDLKILLGGEHPSAMPGFCLQTAPADAVVIGEGEQTAVEVLQAWASGDDLAQVAGVAFLGQDGQVVLTKKRPRIRELQALPQPAWHLFDIEGYQRRRFVGGALWQGRRSLPMLASRGCPYQCTFCTSPAMWSPLWLPRTPADVVAEMVELRDRYQVFDFSLHDLTTVVRRSWVEELCREIIAQNVGVSWQLHSGTRLEQVDAELLDLMRRAGLAYLVLAPESASERTRARVQKRMKTSDIERAIADAVASGIPLKVQVMNGLPGDEHRDALANVRFAARLGKLGVDAVGTAIFAPYPGTALFDELLQKGDIELGEDLIFFTVANNDFAKPLIRGQPLSAGATKLYQLATLGSFVAAKAVWHPQQTAGSVWRAARGGHEKQFFDKLLRALGTAVVRLAVPATTGEPVTWPAIDYRRFAVAELVRPPAV